MSPPPSAEGTDAAEVPMTEMARLKKIINRLRSPGGCPWDLEQTAQSLRPFLLEEAHEVAEAISSTDQRQICEELGDLLFATVNVAKDFFSTYLCLRLNRKRLADQKKYRANEERQSR